MNIQAWAIITTGLADGYELTKSPARVQAAKENGQTVVELVEKKEQTISYEDEERALKAFHDSGIIDSHQYIHKLIQLKYKYST